jgi:23S rRNA pseudoU1915 N3-methylase RlmH
LRAFEASQRRLESLEAQVIEKQRLRGVIAYSFAKEQFKERKRLEAIRLEEERKQREAEEARKREEERLRKEAEAAEQARLKRLEEERRIAEEARIAKLKAELEERENRALRRFQQGSSPSVEDNVLEEIQDFLSTN